MKDTLINRIKRWKNKKAVNPSFQISLCGKLEAIVGGYFLSHIGVSENGVETLYYDPSVDVYESVETSKENIVAYFLRNESIALVKKEMLPKLKEDTKEYDIIYYEVENFEAETLSIDDIKPFDDFLNGLIWIDDDFMYDESIPFNFELFEIIDSKVPYLNPKHFSVDQLIRALDEAE